ncbi:hypothetical protein [Dactylosporangium sp. CA-233914]
MRRLVRIVAVALLLAPAALAPGAAAWGAPAHARIEGTATAS